MKVYKNPLSHSSISMYQECPQKFKFKYIDKLPEAPKWFFSFGQSVHKALEFFYAVAAPPPPALKEVLAHYKRIWKKEGYKDPVQEQEYFEDGERILTAFYDKHIGAFKVPLFTEYQFKYQVEGVAVTGFVDRIDKLDGGKLAVVDYKTGKAIKKERVAEDPQLTMYQMAVEELLGAPVESLTFYHLPSQTALTAPPHGKELVAGLRERVVRTHDAIEARKFDPAPEEKKCQWCDYRPYCPVFKDVYAAPAASAPMPMPMPMPKASPPVEQGTAVHDRLAELVDRYGALQEQARAMQEEAAGVQGEIVSLLRQNGYVRAFGSRFEVSVDLARKWDFSDRGKVLDILKRHGLYDRVLKPSAPEVYKLLEGRELPVAAREELERIGERRELPSLSLKRL